MTGGCPVCSILAVLAAAVVPLNLETRLPFAFEHIMLTIPPIPRRDR